MAYVITSACIGVKDGSCVEVCPVECVHEAGDQFVIHPDECINCGLCAVTCPVGAIYEDRDVPADQHTSIARNREFFL